MGASDTGTLVAILAAGESRRMGSAKVLEPYEQGSMLEHALRVACASRADKVCVVSGAYRNPVEAVASSFGVESVFNEFWELGQSTSVVAAVRHCCKTPHQSLLVMLADQPNITVEAINLIIGALGSGTADVYRSAAPGYTGNPCGFRPTCFPLLETITGDEGARQFFKQASSHGLRIEDVEFQDATLFADVDTPEDFVRLSFGTGAAV